jgi:hypothetical protein
MARRLQATAIAGQLQDLAVGGDFDRADLNRADLAEDKNGFHDVLLSLLLGRRFQFSRLPEGTVEDWLWFRLHALHLAAGDNEHSPLWNKQLEELRQDALALPPSHYDPMSLGQQGAASLQGAQAGINAGALPGLAESPLGAGLVRVAQTLNFAKVLFLTAQFSHAVQQVRSQERCLHGPALHLALVLHRAGTLDAMACSETPLNVTSLVCDYAVHLGCGEQLQYLRVLDLPDRVQALERVLLSGGMGTNDELLGYIDDHGRHRPGLLEKTLQEDGSGGGAEFVELCAKAGRTACEHGQYREALRLFHLGRCHCDVLQVLRRGLSLPIWNDPAAAASDEAILLAEDIQRFFKIYEKNLDRYALSSHAWAVARKLYAARMFHTLCSQGQPLAALDIFDSEQLLPLGSEPPRGAEIDSEIFAEYPRIVDDYVQILRHASGQGVVTAAALRNRLRQLQAFLAANLHNIVLRQDTATALAQLALC